MKATGIVRRIDDLGRVVIPKELRRAMNIKEGDPLELYTEGNFICLKKYMIDRDWAKAKMVAMVIVGSEYLANECQFAIYDEDFNRKVTTDSNLPLDASNIDSPFMHKIEVNGECIGWFVPNIDENPTFFDNIAMALGEVLKVEGE